jgi:hypothetical protein
MADLQKPQLRVSVYDFFEANRLGLSYTSTLEMNPHNPHGPGSHGHPPHGAPHGYGGQQQHQVFILDISIHRSDYHPYCINL